MISPKHKQVWERMKQLEANDGNRKNYREALRMAQPPYLLHLGTLLKDLTFIGDGNPDRLKNNPDLINVTKLTMVRATASAISQALLAVCCRTMLRWPRVSIEHRSALASINSRWPRPRRTACSRCRSFKQCGTKPMGCRPRMATTSRFWSVPHPRTPTRLANLSVANCSAIAIVATTYSVSRSQETTSRNSSVRSACSVNEKS